MNSHRLIIQQMEAESSKSKSNAATVKASGHLSRYKIFFKKTRRSGRFGQKKLIKVWDFLFWSNERCNSADESRAPEGAEPHEPLITCNKLKVPLKSGVSGLHL